MQQLYWRAQKIQDCLCVVTIVYASGQWCSQGLWVNPPPLSAATEIRHKQDNRRHSQEYASACMAENFVIISYLLQRFRCKSQSGEYGSLRVDRVQQSHRRLHPFAALVPTSTSLLGRLQSNILLPSAQPSAVVSRRLDSLSRSPETTDRHPGPLRDDRTVRQQPKRSLHVTGICNLIIIWLIDY